MGPVEGSLARTFDFGEAPASGAVVPPKLRLAPSPGGLHGPDKYKVLEHRRRQAQIRARRLLDLSEAG